MPWIVVVAAYAASPPGDSALAVDGKSLPPLATMVERAQDPCRSDADDLASALVSVGASPGGDVSALDDAFELAVHRGYAAVARARRVCVRAGVEGVRPVAAP